MAEQRVPVGVRFRNAGKVYYFDAGDFDLDVGNRVIVETSHGREVGRVVIAPQQVIASEIKETLKPIIRMAEAEDLRRVSELSEKAAEQLVTAREKVQEHGLDIRLIRGEYSLDGSQLTLYFTAEERVDFRSVVKDLSSVLDAKVQLLQVGDRDRAKMADGIGRCGERLCCSSWLTAFPTVSIKMAKEQELPLNPGKISGVCGRLLCCLTYEYQAYRDLRGTLPKVGKRVSTPAGEAKVVGINVPKEVVTLRLVANESTIEMPLRELQVQYGTVVRPAELAEEIEKTPPEPAAESVPQETETPPEEAEKPAEPAPRRRRRRGRRGGRRSGRRGPAASGDEPKG